MGGGSELLCCLLGAGFSRHAGLPLAAELFDNSPAFVTGTHQQERLLKVKSSFDLWRSKHPTEHSEQFVGYVQRRERDLLPAVVEWIGCVLTTAHTPATPFAHPRYQNDVSRPLGIQEYVEFWRILLRQKLCGIISLNYDLIVERSLRTRRMPRLRLPGVHYAGLPHVEKLEGKPAMSLRRQRLERAKINGKIPLAKMHGSLNWSIRSDFIRCWIDARPAFRKGGDCAIVAPTKNKSIPPAFEPIWKGAAEILKSSRTILVCGYSFPVYDKEFHDFVRSNARSIKRVVIASPDSASALVRARPLFCNASFACVSGFPTCLPELQNVL